MDGTIRAEIHLGDTVEIVLKADQASGKMTRGVVGKILTKSSNHPRGIKVQLADGQVGRVCMIVSMPRMRSI